MSRTLELVLCEDVFFYSVSERVWPRLQTAMEKPHWISIDFNRWEYQKESDDEDDEQNEQEVDPEKMARVVSSHRKRKIRSYLVEHDTMDFSVQISCLQSVPF